MNREDSRVKDPGVRWRKGAGPELRNRAITQLLWLQIANCLAHGNVAGAHELVGVFEQEVGPGRVAPEDAVAMHGAMTFARLLAGADPVSYLRDLESVLANFFVQLEQRLSMPGFAERAMNHLRQRHTDALVEETKRLAGLVDNYRRSRSYRLGRFLTSPFRRPAR
jgi:hypothetical protein